MWVSLTPQLAALQMRSRFFMKRAVAGRSIYESQLELSGIQNRDRGLKAPLVSSVTCTMSERPLSRNPSETLLGGDRIC